MMFPEPRLQDGVSAAPRGPRQDRRWWVLPARPAWAAVLAGLLAAGCGSSAKPSANTPPSTGGDPPAAGAQAQATAAKTEPGPKTEPKPPAAAAAWTLDAKAMQTPNAPAVGVIHGQNFKPDKVKLDNGVLTLSQGQGFPPDLEVSVLLFLNRGEKPEGKRYEFPGEDPVGILPQVHVSRKLPGQNFPQTDRYPDKYALKLEFDKAEDDKLPGRIYLSLPEEPQGFVAGTFRAELPVDYSQPPRPKDAPSLFGRIALKGKGPFKLEAGYIGQNAKGDWQSNMAGMSAGDGDFGSWATSTTNAPRLTTLAYEKEAGCTYQHVKLEPGRYLVYVRWNERYFDWRWTELKDGGQLTIDLTVDPTTVGALEVTLPNKPADDKVFLIPLDQDGKLPELKIPPEAVAAALPLEVASKEKKVVLEGLRAGSYRVRAGKVQADVQVKAGTTTKVDVPATK